MTTLFQERITPPPKRRKKDTSQETMIPTTKGELVPFLSERGLESYGKQLEASKQKFIKSALEMIASRKESPEETVERETGRINDERSELEKQLQSMDAQIRNPWAAFTIFFDKDPTVNLKRMNDLVEGVKKDRKAAIARQRQLTDKMQVLDEGLKAIKSRQRPQTAFMQLLAELETGAAQDVASAQSVIPIWRQKFLDTRIRLKALADLRAEAETT